MNQNSGHFLRNHRVLFLCLMMLLSLVLLTDPIVAGLVVFTVVAYAFAKNSEADCPALPSDAS